MHDVNVDINVRFVSQSQSHEDVTTWLALTLEIKKLETEQTCLQNEVQKLKKNCEDHSLLNLDIARLTADIEAIDIQMVGMESTYFCIFLSL